MSQMGGRTDGDREREGVTSMRTKHIYVCVYVYVCVCVCMCLCECMRKRRCYIATKAVLKTSETFSQPSNPDQ